jgi:hypothetical protein
MIFDFVGFAQIADHILIAIPADLFWVLAVLTAFAGVGLMWLANRTQPRPLPGLWALSAVDRDLRHRS